MTLTESSRKSGALAQFRQVYSWQLKKSRVLSLVYAVLTLLCFTVVFLCQSISKHAYYFNGGEKWAGESSAHLTALFSQALTSNLDGLICLALIPLSLLYLVIFCVTAFGYMHKRRSVDLFHALPIRRTPLLMGNFAAGCTVLLLVVVVNCLLCSVIAFAMGAGTPFTLPWLLSGIGYLLLLLAAGMALTLFLLVASGTMVNAVLSGILFSLAWPVLCVCGASVICMTLPGCALTTTGTVATACVPYLAIFMPFLHYGSSESVSSVSDTGDTYVSSRSVYPEMHQISTLSVVWWCCFALLLLAAAILIYRKRKSECAENNFSFPALRIVIQFLASGAFGLGCGMVFGEILKQNWVFFLAVAVGAAVAHTVTQLVWIKGLREFKKSMPVYGVLMASLCVFFVVLSTGGLGYVTRLPNVEKVQEVTIQMPNYHYDDSAKSYLARNTGLDIQSTKEGNFYCGVSPKLQEQSSIQTVAELHQALINRNSVPYLPCHENEEDSCTITYQLSNGKTMKRNYALPATENENASNEWSLSAEKTTCDAQTIQKMAKVVALDEYQECSLYYYLNPDQISTVRSQQSTDDEETSGSQDNLTAAQKKKVWATFRKELESSQFTFTDQESAGGTSKKCYYIELESTWKGRDWTKDLYDMLKKNADQDISAIDRNKLELNSNDKSTFQVPNSCPKTQTLIKNYIGDNVETVPQDDAEK